MPDPPHPPKHIPTKNPPDFTFPNRDAPKTRSVLGPNLRRETFRGVCNTPLHGYVQNLAGFIFPNKDTPKTRPVLRPNLRRGAFRGVCFCALHGYVQNLLGFTPKPSARGISGRMQYAPTRVHEKFVQFHISAHGYTKNAPDFTFPNRDTYKTYPVLGANLRRCYFRGVCNTPLHGYVHNSSSFIFPHTNTPKTHPISPFPIGIHPKPVRF